MKEKIFAAAYDRLQLAVKAHMDLKTAQKQARMPPTESAKDNVKIMREHHKLVDKVWDSFFIVIMEMDWHEEWRAYLKERHRKEDEA